MGLQMPSMRSITDTASKVSMPALPKPAHEDADIGHAGMISPPNRKDVLHGKDVLHAGLVGAGARARRLGAPDDRSRRSSNGLPACAASRQAGECSLHQRRKSWVLAHAVQRSALYCRVSAVTQAAVNRTRGAASPRVHGEDDIAVRPSSRGDLVLRRPLRGAGRQRSASGALPGARSSLSAGALTATPAARRELARRRHQQG